MTLALPEDEPFILPMTGAGAVGISVVSALLLLKDGFLFFFLDGDAERLRRGPVVSSSLFPILLLFSILLEEVLLYRRLKTPRNPNLSGNPICAFSIETRSKRRCKMHLPGGYIDFIPWFPPVPQHQEIPIGFPIRFSFRAALSPVDEILFNKAASSMKQIVPRNPCAVVVVLFLR